MLVKLTFHRLKLFYIFLVPEIGFFLNHGGGGGGGRISGKGFKFINRGSFFSDISLRK